MTFRSRLKTYFFRLAFDCSVHVWPHHIPASAPEVTTLWRYVNQFIIIIIIIIIIICCATQLFHHLIFTIQIMWIIACILHFIIPSMDFAQVIEILFKIKAEEI